MNKKVTLIIIALSIIILCVVCFLFGGMLGECHFFNDNKIELTIEDINNIEKPLGYSCQVFDSNDLIEEYVYYYQDDLKEQLGLIPHHFNILKWSSGPEDGMIYTLCDTNSDGSNYVLFITNPNDKQRFVACGVQEDEKYYTYTFIY